MIRISQIDENLSIYKKCDVILIEIGKDTKDLIKLLENHNINIIYICSCQKDNWHTIFEGYQVVPFRYLFDYNKHNSKEILIQVSTRNIDKSIIEALNSIKIKYIVSYDEAWETMNFMNKLSLLEKNKHIISAYEPLSIDVRILNKRPEAFDYIYKKNYLEEYLFICSIPKTGDVTLMRTFKTNYLDFYMSLHTPEVLDKKIIATLGKKVKVILGVRDPIAQNISFLYHTLGEMSLPAFAYHLENDNKDFFRNGGDAQNLFELAYDSDKCFNEIIPREASNCYIQDFIDRFEESILDITKYEFDKEKGFSIIKEDNLEIFIYQIEKMNTIISEMSNWVGQREFDEWVIGNEASSKWISSSYKQAQKDIKFSKEYFNKCYNDPWIKHFYSKDDIDKFKLRWKPHVKGNMTPIVFICEEENIKELSVAIVSLLENANIITEYEIYILSKQKYSNENNNIFLELENNYKGCRIIFKTQDIISNFDCISISNFISKTLTNINKCIYLDSNVVVQQDLGSLYGTKLDDFSIGAVNEIVDDEFSNNVLIIDTKQVRNSKLSIKHIELKFNLKSEYFVQEKSFNFNSKIKMNSALQKKFDINELKYSLKDNVIFSYNSENYPLASSESSFWNEWWKYFKKSPFSNRERKHCENPKISIIMPIYNVGIYLHDSLYSIINQTLEDIEIICVNDGSTDNSHEILEIYANFDKRIKIIYQENQGAGAARNTGLDIARGDYLSFLDPDDFFELTMLEELWNKAKSNEDIDIVIYDYLQYNNKLDVYTEPKTKIPEIDQIFSYDSMSQNIFYSFYDQAWNKLFRLDFIKKNKIRFQKLYRADDVYFTQLALILAKWISVTNKKYVYYRIQNANSSQGTNYLYPLDFYKAELALRDKFKEIGIYEKIKTLFLNKVLSDSIDNLARNINNIVVKDIFYHLSNNLEKDFGFDNYNINIYQTNLFHEFMLIKNNSFENYMSIKNLDIPDGLINVINDNIKLSVIIPVYNAQDFLYDSIQSVLTQTLKEIEIICVDDGSTDKSLEILNNLAKTNNNIIIITQSNQLAPVARNNGVKHARGEYIYFFDSDDLLYDDFVLEKMYNIAVMNKLDVLRGRAVTFDNDSGMLLDREYFSLKSIKIDDFNRLLDVKNDFKSLFNCSNPPWGGIVRRKFLIENNIEFPNLVCEDASFFIETIVKAKNIMLLDLYILKYRINNSNSFLFARFNKFEHVFLSYNLIEELCYELDNHVAKFLLTKKLEDCLFWLKKCEDTSYFMDNKKLTINFFENLDYSYWVGKENCLPYARFEQYIKIFN